MGMNRRSELAVAGLLSGQRRSYTTTWDAIPRGWLIGRTLVD
jgi:hypothetical protein